MQTGNWSRCGIKSENRCGAAILRIGMAIYDCLTHVSSVGDSVDQTGQVNTVDIFHVVMDKEGFYSFKEFTDKLYL